MVVNPMCEYLMISTHICMVVMISGGYPERGPQLQRATVSIRELLLFRASLSAGTPTSTLLRPLRPAGGRGSVAFFLFYHLADDGEAPALEDLVLVLGVQRVEDPVVAIAL